jgi:uncharacterized RDD family membrane protein YckC
MAAGAERLAHIFVWKEGSPPDLDYARQVLRVANPQAYRLALGESPPIHLFGVAGPWPADPWARALADMSTVPAPEGTSWADLSRYELSGWQGTDLNTGQRLFVVTVYRRAGYPSGAEGFRGIGVGGPPYAPAAIPQVPYYSQFQQFPPGPLIWPPAAPGQVPYPGQPGGYWPPGYPYAYSPLTTLPLAAPPTETGHLIEDYAQFYVGFGPRLAAQLIDTAFILLVQVAVVLAVLLAGYPAPGIDLTYWRDEYTLLACQFLLFVVAYYTVSWSVWGQTPGKRLVGIKVVNAEGGRPGVGKALLRMVGYFFSLALAGWGFFMVALDPRRQGLHDKIAETYVVPERQERPVPAGLPGYAPSPATAPAAPSARPAVGMATIAGPRPYEVVEMRPPAAEGQPQPPTRSEPGTSPASPAGAGKAPGVEMPRTTGVLRDLVGTTPDLTAETPAPAPAPVPVPEPEEALPVAGGLKPEGLSRTERARVLFKAGLAEMERGAGLAPEGYRVEAGAARLATGYFRQALELVPNSVVYRYFYAIALRYSEGFEAALREFRRVLELDPTHYEARMQVTYGPRWHDAFAYPPVPPSGPVDVGRPLPVGLAALLPPGQQPATRLVLLRESGNKVASFLSRTPRSAWAVQPVADIPAHLHVRVSRTPFGPILALYIVVEDNPHNPYIGETFLNPRDAGHPSDDACLLGQHMLEQLARQDHIYLIFADERNNLLLSRRLAFDSATQVMIARSLYEVQTLPPQVLDPERFRQAAQWHMQHFSLDQLKTSSTQS